MEHNLYKVTFKWYNKYKKLENGEYIEGIDTTCFYAFASSITELTERIEQDYCDIQEIKIKEITYAHSSTDFFYVDTLSKAECKKLEESNHW